MTNRCFFFLMRITALVALCALFLGCPQKSPNMAALTQIDSLLQKKDYAEAVKEISVIDPASLDEGERALYALLLTEAKYKNYDPITSDSLISQAVRYYRDSNGLSH